MYRKKRLLALLLMCLSGIAVAVPQHRFITHFIMPFSYEENGEFKGFAVELVKEMMGILNHPAKFEMFPFSRALYTVETDTNTVLFIVARRPERESAMKWVGPLIKSGVYFYKHRDNPVKLNTLEDLKKLQSVGVGRGNADHRYLSAQGFENLHPNNDQLISLLMLVNQRIDVTVGSELVMPEMAKQAGIDLSEIERTDIKLYDSVLYLGFSLDIPNEEVQRWQQALDSLIISGRYDELYQKYVH